MCSHCYATRAPLKIIAFEAPLTFLRSSVLALLPPTPIKTLEVHCSPHKATKCLMKVIVSLFISAYQPGMASIEYQRYSFSQSRQPLFFSGNDGCSEAGVYKDKVYYDWPNEELDRSEGDCLGGLYFEDQSFEGRRFEDKRFENLPFEDAHFENPSYENLCWMISRTRRSQPLGYYVMSATTPVMQKP